MSDKIISKLKFKTDNDNTYVIRDESTSDGLSSHVVDGVVHITSAERTYWNGKSEFDSSYNSLTDKPVIISESAVDAKVQNALTSAVNAVSAHDAGDGAHSTLFASKANVSDFTSHSGDTVVHITSAERTSWNGKAEVSAIPTKVSDLANDSLYQTLGDVTSAVSVKVDSTALSSHTGDTVVHITSAERTYWNGKSEFDSSYNSLTDKPSINDAKITIQLNGTSAGSFTLNQGTASTVDLGSLVTTSAYNAGMALKANVASSISGYGITDAYTKTEVDAKVSSVYHYKGTKSTYAQLPASGNEVGDVWNVETANSTYGIRAGDNVAWTGSSWDKLGGDVDLSGYVEKETGKGLSTNDFSNGYKAKLDGIASGAEVNVQADWNETSTGADSYIKNKPTIPTVNNSTITIQLNGTTVDSFTVNASSAKTINISGVAKASDLTSYVKTAAIGSSVASLGSDGKVPSSQLPSLDYVPLTRTINGKALSSNVSLTAHDLNSIEVVETMPSNLTSADEGKVYLYVGATNDTYTKYHIYRYSEDDGITPDDSSKYALTTLANGGTIQQDGHYTMTATGTRTIYVASGTSGYVANAELYINPGSYTMTFSGVTLVNELVASKTNHCVIKWNGTTARLYVIDSY